jgi:hypothetical protein
MASYKNIPLFDDFDSQDFLVWRELFLSYPDANNPANEKELPDAAEVSGDAAEEAAEEVAAAVAAVDGAEETRKKANAAAKAHMLLFLDPTQRTQLLNLHVGVQMWADLHV